MGITSLVRQTLLVQLTRHDELDRLQDVIARLPRLVPKDASILVYTGFDEDGVPISALAVLRLVELVGTSDIGVRCVADEVDGLRRSLQAMGVLTPLAEKPGSEIVCTQLRFAVNVDILKVLARDGSEESFKRCA